LEYKNNAVPENSNVPATQLATEFVPQNLSETQIDDLVAFLKFREYTNIFLYKIGSLRIIRTFDS